MEAVYTAKEGSYCNTVRMFYIYGETKNGNKPNRQYMVQSKAILQYDFCDDHPHTSVLHWYVHSVATHVTYINIILQTYKSCHVIVSI